MLFEATKQILRTYNHILMTKIIATIETNILIFIVLSKLYLADFNYLSSKRCLEKHCNCKITRFLNNDRKGKFSRTLRLYLSLQRTLYLSGRN